MNPADDENTEDLEGDAFLRRMRKVQLQEAAAAALGCLVFILVTLLLLADLVTDVWVLVLYAIQDQRVFLGVGCLFMVVASLHVGLVYASQSYAAGKEQSRTKLVCCFLLNVPFQLGIVFHRLGFCERHCSHCCGGAQPPDARLAWHFIKLKFVQAMFQSLPQLLLNSLHILVYAHHQTALVQYASATVSFLSIITGVTLYEHERKAESVIDQSLPSNLLQVLFIFIYKLFIMGSRVTAVINFMYFYGEWAALLFLVHFLVVLTAFSFVYRKLSTVRFKRIFCTSLYCLFGYFPAHDNCRPEGEIMLFYAFFMAENVFMVALPFFHAPTRHVASWHLPHTEYYKVMTLTTLLGSATGLIFMALYYFVLHRASSDVTRRDGSRLGRFPCCACVESSSAERRRRSSERLAIINSSATSVDESREYPGDVVVFDASKEGS